MTERELLELAATAAGLSFDPAVNHPQGLLVVPPGAECQSEQVIWNALHNDADAFQLLVLARLDVHQFYNNVVACRAGAVVRHEDRVPSGQEYEERCAAIRRAIVLATIQLE